jgi:hypothetical protein
MVNNRNLFNELKEGMDALTQQRESKNVNDIPQGAYILPDEKTGYIAVWQTNEHLCIKLLYCEGIVVYLDKKILPHLVDALIDLQNERLS